ncbi:hypothetical protein QQF64_017070 [Cirrhinus molitorella]|uniref:Uncharacterized protein n=1 Tax=Cirrhinus molitorella TaxID=172907 RepID=A0ABR3LHL3_9TELE
MSEILVASHGDIAQLNQSYEPNIECDLLIQWHRQLFSGSWTESSDRILPMLLPILMKSSYSQDWQNYMAHLRAVLRALRGAGLTTNPKKCATGQVVEIEEEELLVLYISQKLSKRETMYSTTAKVCLAIKCKVITPVSDCSDCHRETGIKSNWRMWRKRDGRKSSCMLI